MVAIEKDNAPLKGVLPKDYARPTLDKQRLGELIDLIGTIGLGDKESRSKDILGRVYEYFLSKFASAEGKGGGEFYTPQSVVKLLVQMIEPYNKVDPFVKTGGRAVLRATLLLFLLSYYFFRINQSVYLLNTLQQEFGNQGLDESADDYKTRNSFLTAGELLSVRYSHANRLLHI